MRCKNCGNEVPETANVCGYCGNRLRTAAPPPQPEVRRTQPAARGIPGWVWGCGGVALVFGVIAVIGMASLSNLTNIFAAKPQPTVEPATTRISSPSTQAVESNPQPTAQQSGWVSVVEEDFSDPVNGRFGEIRKQDYSSYYEGGSFHIQVEIPNTYYWMGLDANEAGDVAVEVQARLVDGADDSSMGVTCRQNGQNYYFFQINNEGQARISKYAEASGWESLTEWEQSSAYQPYDWNVIYVQCNGSELLLEINNELAATAYDSTFSLGGVGLIGGAGDTPGAHVEFDNFEYWEYR